MSSDPDDLLDDIEIKEEMEEEAEIHEFGALNTLLFVVVLVMCILLAFILKQHRCYYLSETAAVLLVGVAVGLAARVFFYSQEELDFLYFQPELRAQVEFMSSKGKTRSAAIFKALLVLRPFWAMLLSENSDVIRYKKSM